MTDKKLMFTVWDVGHGVSIWIKTPNPPLFTSVLEAR